MSMILVRALDGRWNYGPSSLADSLRSEEHGVYTTPIAALEAMRTEAMQ